MGLLTSLFGGSESKTESTQVPVLSPQQQALLKSLTKQVQTGLSGPQPTAPPMSVPQTAQEDTYFNWVNSLSNQTALKNLLSGTPSTEVNPEATEQYFEQAVRPEMMREFEQVTLPTLRTAYSGPGYWGSARAGAETKAGSDLAYNLAKSKADLLYKDEQARRDLAESAYEKVLPTSQYMTETYGGAGEYSRGIEQEKVAENLQRFLMGEEVDGQYSLAYNPNVALALSLLGIQPYGIGTTTTSKESGGIIPGLASLASGAGSIASAGGLSKLFGDVWNPSPKDFKTWEEYKQYLSHSIGGV